MRLMNRDLGGVGGDALRVSVSREWSWVLIAVAAFIAWLCVWYWDTLASMVSIWYRSETFAHGFLVFPISAWLVWRRRTELAQLTPAPGSSRAPLVAIALAALLWLAADLADVLPARHFAWMTMFAAGVWLLVGDAIARRIAFPLAFLYFAIPVGEFMLPTLIEWTADFTVAALRASGVPVLRDGMNFEIPSGRWSVVEACSGLRYLIASVTVGVLYAYLSYRSLSRRLLFIIASLLVPIVANWLRAYMIVMIGHLSGNKLAVGIDHLIYGWIFFGVVMLLLFGVGSIWRQDTEEKGSDTADAVPAASRSRPQWIVLLVALAVTAAAPAAVALLHRYDLQASVDARAPVLADWRPVEGSSVVWTPEFTTPRAVIASAYEDGRGASASLYVALYFDQDRDSKLVSSNNQLKRTLDNIGWVSSERKGALRGDNGQLDYDETVLRLRDRRVVARTWYWIDGEYTASAVRAKLLQARARLMGRGDAGALIVVMARAAGDDVPQLDRFTRAAADALGPVLAERLRGTP